MSILLPQMPAESMLSPPHSWEHRILLNPENYPSNSLAYPSSALHLNPFPCKPSLFPQAHSHPYPGPCSKLCSCVIAQPSSHPWNAARVKFSQDPPGWSLFTCPARSHSCLCWHNRSPAPPRLCSNSGAHLQLWGNSFFKWGKNQEFYQLSLSLWFFPHTKCSN